MSLFRISSLFYESTYLNKVATHESLRITIDPTLCKQGEGGGLKKAVGVENENETGGEAKQGRQQMNEALNGGGERRNSGKRMMMGVVFCTQQ